MKIKLTPRLLASAFRLVVEHAVGGFFEFLMNFMNRTLSRWSAIRQLAISSLNKEHFLLIQSAEPIHNCHPYNDRALHHQFV